jgi:CheY-like chemotaxis protein
LKLKKLFYYKKIDIIYIIKYRRNSVKKTKSQPLISRIYTFFINLFQTKRDNQKNYKKIPKEDENSSYDRMLNQTEDLMINKSIQTTSNSTIVSSTKQIKALVVEDNNINIKIMQLSLNSININSDIAENGKIAYEMRMKNQYDIIFMDIHMPVMDGVESKDAILKYEKKHNLPHIPIVAVTANALKGDRERFLEGGMDEYISKPINLDKFRRVLKKFFPTHSWE